LNGGCDIDNQQTSYGRRIRIIMLDDHVSCPPSARASAQRCAPNGANRCLTAIAWCRQRNVRTINVHRRPGLLAIAGGQFPDAVAESGQLLRVTAIEMWTIPRPGSIVDSR
jgi:hypothetical protein